MIATLMAGLNEKNMQAVVNNLNLNNYYFPTIFPIKQTRSLTWKSLSTKVGLHIAGDLIARGSRLSAKTREALKRIEGDIPKIGIERKMTEEEMTEYQQALALAQSEADLVNLVETWANDLAYCWEGVGARIEWMALYSVSHGGKLTVTSENNAHVTSEYNADYNIPAAQKLGVTTAWKTSPSTATPFSVDFKGIINAAKAQGINLKHVWLSQATFNTLVETAEAQKLCATYVQNALNVQTIPGVAELNAMAARHPYLNGITFHVIDQYITVEFMDGSRVSGNPFAANVCVFTEEAVLGNTWWVEPVGMKISGTAATKVMREYCMLKKFGNEDPEEEVTQGIANAFPGWAGSERAYFLDTYNSSWSEGAE